MLDVAILGAGGRLSRNVSRRVRQFFDSARLKGLAAHAANALFLASLGARSGLHDLPCTGIVVGDRELVARLGRLVGLGLGHLRGDGRFADAPDSDLAGLCVNGRDRAVAALVGDVADGTRP